MKKFKLFLSLAVAALFAGVAAGSDDPEITIPGEGGDTPTTGELVESFFSIEDAVYHPEAFPQATCDERIEGLSINTQALAGGMNFIIISTNKEYDAFYVGVKNITGYLEFIPMDTPPATSPDEGLANYTIPVLYSTLLSGDITMLISGRTKDGKITIAIEVVITFVSSMSGDLNVNLTFSNAKDVDLHLYCPDGEHIFYGNRGGTIFFEDGTEVTYGLDHDSNAGCSIDNLNNENIYIPAALVQSGTYRVVVDMYANCDYSIGETQWSVVARYKNTLVKNELGDNPVSGVYPADAPSGDMTTVMEFVIDKNNMPAKAKSQKILKVVPIPLTDMDEFKLDETFDYLNGLAM